MFFRMFFRSKDRTPGTGGGGGEQVNDNMIIAAKRAVLEQELDLFHYLRQSGL